MRRRLTTTALAVFYLLQATWLLHAGADLVFPRLRILPVAADACCARACGCPEEAQRNRTCCCSKESPAPKAAAPTPGPVSSIEEARCRGVEAAMAQAFTQPVLCSVAAVSLPERVLAHAAAPEQSPSLPPRADALEKVPIAQA
jgi:hypothetical protein